MMFTLQYQIWPYLYITGGIWCCGYGEGWLVQSVPESLCCIRDSVGPGAGWTWRCCLFGFFTIGTSGWPCWLYALHRQSPRCWSGCTSWHKLGQLPPKCQDLSCSTSGRPSECFYHISFDLHGSICLLWAHQRAASLPDVHHTYKTCALPTSAGISEFWIYMITIFAP